MSLSSGTAAPAPEGSAGPSSGRSSAGRTAAGRKGSLRGASSTSPRRLAPLLAAEGPLSFVVDLALLLALFAAVCGPFLVRVHETALPGGWDGVPHHAIADLYARRLFPAISGWMPEYFAGMPYPNFYPPVFYMVVAALTKLGASTRDAFLGVQTAASIAVPLLTYLCGRRLAESRAAGLVAGALATGLMVDHNPLWRMGISLPSTFDAGLSTQLLGHCFLLLFFHALLHADRRRASAALAALFFGLVVLTNVHMVWAAAFLFVPLSTARILGAPSRPERLRALLLHAAIGATAVLVSAAWVWPMIANLRFVPTAALPPPGPGVVTFAFLRLGVYLVFGTLAAVSRRDGPAVSLAAGLFLLLAFTVLPSARWLALDHLALQPARIVIPFPFLMPLLVGYLVSAAGDLFRWPHARLAAGALCAAVFFSHFKLETRPEGNVSAAQVASYQGALDALAGRHDGRVLVEMGTDGISDPFALQALAGASGAHSLTTVFRESALDVLFAVPLRNTFSASQEAFGVDHKIDAADLAADPLARHLARLRLFNIRYFALQSDAARARVAALPGVRRASAPGAWELFAFEDPAPGYALIPAFEPVLTIAGFSVKPRPDDGLDFVRLGEEMFAAGRLDTPLALSPCPTIEDCPDWERFQTALLLDCRYRDRARALATIERFSRDRHVVLLASGDPLTAELSRLARPTIHVVDGGSSAGGTKAERRAWARALATRLLDTIDAVHVPVSDAPSVVAAELEGESADITLSREPDRLVPVWVRQGYFPSWENPDGEPVYMATPTFQLTFTRQREVHLRFSATAVEHAGRLASLVGLLAICRALLARRRARGPGRGRPAEDTST